MAGTTHATLAGTCSGTLPEALGMPVTGILCGFPALGGA